MKPFSARRSPPPSMLQQLLRWTSGSSLLRSRSTAASLMRSMRCSELAAHAHQLDHGELRDREAVAAGLHDQRRDDRERERDLDGEARAFAGHRLDVDGAADLIDVGAHHVHADAAAGHAGHLRRRWRSRARR